MLTDGPWRCTLPCRASWDLDVRLIAVRRKTSLGSPNPFFLLFRVMGLVWGPKGQAIRGWWGSGVFRSSQTCRSFQDLLGSPQVVHQCWRTFLLDFVSCWHVVIRPGSLAPPRVLRVHGPPLLPQQWLWSQWGGPQLALLLRVTASGTEAGTASIASAESATQAEKAGGCAPPQGQGVGGRQGVFG